jgi:hypothetical protein
MGIEAEYHAALYSALYAARATLGVNDVYDIKPQASDHGDDTVFPYIVIGSVFIVEGDTQTKNGFEITCRIHTHSRAGAKLECKTIQGEIYDLLHRVEMNVTGFNNYSLLRQDTDCSKKDDSEIHGICEYRALLEVS